jgi:hypothetical protein
MKQSTILWIVGAAVVFYLFSKSSSASRGLSDNQLNATYAGDATSIIEDLF